MTFLACRHQHGPLCRPAASLSIFRHSCPYCLLLLLCDFVRSVGVNPTVLPCCPRRRLLSIALLPLIFIPWALDQTNGSRSTVRVFLPPSNFSRLESLRSGSYFEPRPGLLYIVSLARHPHCYSRHVRLLRAEPSDRCHWCMACTWPPVFLGTACPSFEIRLVTATTRRPRTYI